jgi:hypothetical protein
MEKEFLNYVEKGISFSMILGVVLPIISQEIGLYPHYVPPFDGSTTNGN